MNSCIFAGKITNELELKKVNNVNYINFSLAVAKVSQRKDGTLREEIAYPEFEIWDSGAVSLYKNTKKGDRIMVECCVKPAKDKTTEIESNSVNFRVNHYEIMNTPVES
jgi:single-stranded DNA-binding protein